MVSSVFIPQVEQITAIQLGQRTIVTTLEDHYFTAGEIISFRVSRQYGTRELNNRQGLISSKTDDTITVEIDSSSFTPFIYPVSRPVSLAVVVPVGSGIEPNVYPPTVTLKDAFDDVRT